MKAIRLALGSLLIVAFSASISMAQAQRTFVSGLGNDSNPCNRTAPCRTFAQAISQTNSSGEVYVLDSAGYATFTITKPISVVAPPGVTAGVSVFSGDGITINLPTDGEVILRGLTITNQGSNGNGIVYNSVSPGNLHVESCVVHGFTAGPSAGIAIRAPGEIFVTDTIARDNFGGISVDIITSGNALLTMDQVHLNGNNTGLSLSALGAGALLIAAIRSSSCSGNGNIGMSVNASSGGTASLDAESCLVANNATGLEASGSSGGTATASISNCTLSRNGAAGFVVSGAGATIFSRGNNTILGNGANVGPLSPLAGQ
jgi:hypothetical protein